MTYLPSKVPALVFAALTAASPAMADQISDAEALVNSYYTAAAQDDWNTLYALFSEDSTIKISMQFGGWIPDEHFTFKSADLMNADNSGLEELEKFTQSNLSHRIVKTEEVGDTIKVYAVQTSTYAYEDHTGDLTENDTFVIANAVGQPLVQTYQNIQNYE
ncbi:hypothetical protein ROA7450_02834 [Roseovarius albus]|uniref:SnoaL-like domain-containing protein n=1 Tax=Roseovarius albus TaxID=1247867 RepID=A0A1X6ZLH1_9RHOB|nr:hypothetical protein [Roseovarius albus]SLN55044.1 hypothetical protein ROA7450_02834 [Roseovarius albus]